MNHLEQVCRDRGLRFTARRRVVLEVLAASADHPCAGEIHRRVTQRHRLALGTTYRILNRLTKAGVLSRHMFDGDKARYELAGRRHHHLIDRRTGRIVEIDDDILTSLLEGVVRRLGYRLLDYRLELKGEVERSG